MKNITRAQFERLGPWELRRQEREGSTIMSMSARDWYQGAAGKCLHEWSNGGETFTLFGIAESPEYAKSAK